MVFTNAVLLKPRETIPATDLAFTLAPLLVQEVAGAGGGSNLGPATVWYELSAVAMGGIARPQMTYLWSDRKENKVDRGVRVTLDSHGQPAIWEVWDGRPGPRVLFVSQSLEERAQAAFGPPLPGRRFAVEQPVNLAPDMVVARVNDDGPAVMGPIVHLTALNGEISAVICRCMPTQARQLVGTKYYELKPLADAGNVDFAGLRMERGPVEELRLPLRF